MPNDLDSMKRASSTLSRRTLAGLLPGVMLSPLITNDTHARVSSSAAPDTLTATHMAPRLSRGLEQLWTFEATNSSGLPIRIFGDSVYFHAGGEYGHLYSLNLTDGSENWHRSDFGSRNYLISYTISQEGQVLAAASGQGSRLYSLDPLTGSSLWETNVSVDAQSLYLFTQVYDLALLRDQFGRMEAFDVHSGKNVWSLETERPSDAHWSGLSAIGDDLVVQRTGGGTIDAVNINTGEYVWQTSVPDELAYHPVIMSGTVIVGSENGNLYGINLATGETIWTNEFRGEMSLRLRTTENAVLVANSRGRVTAFNPLDGASLWRYSVSNEAPLAMVVENGFAFCRGVKGRLTALDSSTGVPIWSIISDTNEYFDIYAAGETVYVTDGSGNLIGYDAADGTELWRKQFDSNSWVHMAIHEQILVARSNRTLTAFGEPPAILEPSAQAIITERTILRAAPSPIAVERDVLEAEAIVTVTGEFVQHEDNTWWPVSVDETGTEGWVVATALEVIQPIRGE